MGFAVPNYFPINGLWKSILKTHWHENNCAVDRAYSKPRSSLSCQQTILEPFLRYIAVSLGIEGNRNFQLYLGRTRWIALVCWYSRRCDANLTINWWHWPAGGGRINTQAILAETVIWKSRGTHNLYAAQRNEGNWLAPICSGHTARTVCPSSWRSAANDPLWYCP